MSGRRRRAIRASFMALKPPAPESRWRGFKRAFVRNEQFYYTGLVPTVQPKKLRRVRTA